MNRRRYLCPECGGIHPDHNPNCPDAVYEGDPDYDEPSPGWSGEDHLTESDLDILFGED